MRKAIFLDRDGTLNEDKLYPHKIEHFELLPGVIEGLKKLSKDYIFIIITNQSGIGRKVFTEEDFQDFAIAGYRRIKAHAYDFRVAGPVEFVIADDHAAALGIHRIAFRIGQ